MPFDPTIHLGDVVMTLLAAIACGVGFRELSDMKQEIQKLREVVVRQAAADERLNLHEKRLDNLERRGFP